MRRELRSPAVLASAGLLTLAAAQRVWNTVHYPVWMGFDAKANWEYIGMLMQRWTLPAPNVAWSTAHPPFFYALGAVIGRVLDSEPSAVAWPLGWLCAALGLAAVAATARLVHVLSNGNTRRTLLAVMLVVFLPVHIMMSAMLSEEILTSALVSFTLVGLVSEMTRRPEAARSRFLRPVLLGALAGLALLTKLSAVMLVAAGTLTLLADASRRGRRPALSAAASFVTAAGLVGGWFYLRNLLFHGYLYPHGLSVHSVMFTMPPGERGLADYLSFPLDTFNGGRATDPALIHSVWGSTYASVWFDPHRHYLPRHAPGVFLAARVILVTALLPTAAFVVGLLRGALRAWQERSAQDCLLVTLVALMLGGFVVFTFRNPWYVTVKGSFLLGLATPFAVYTSEVLDDWLGRGRIRGLALGTVLAVLFAVSFATFTYQGMFTKLEAPGAQPGLSP